MGNSLIRRARIELKSQQYKWNIKQTLPFSSIVVQQKYKIEGQKYSIDYCMMQQQWLTYILRKNNPQYLVTIYDLISQKQSLCSNNKQISVIIESIPYRLSDLGGLSFTDAMYILKSILLGYRILIQNNLPYYLLDETNICFNKNGICKFWINQNLYLSKPHQSRIINQNIFISNLLQIIQIKIDYLNQDYIQMKSLFQVLTLNIMIHIIQAFDNHQIRSLSSISSIQCTPTTQFRQPHRMYKSINPQRLYEQKMSISKYRLSNRRKDKNKLKYLQQIIKSNNKIKDNSTTKKLSLSFNKNNKNYKYQYQYQQQNNESYYNYLSPQKINIFTPYQSKILKSPRQNTYIKNNNFIKNNKQYY